MAGSVPLEIRIQLARHLIDQAKRPSPRASDTWNEQDLQQFEQETWLYWKRYSEDRVIAALVPLLDLVGDKDHPDVKRTAISEEHFEELSLPSRFDLMVRDVISAYKDYIATHNIDRLAALRLTAVFAVREFVRLRCHDFAVRLARFLAENDGVERLVVQHGEAKRRDSKLPEAWRIPRRIDDLAVTIPMDQIGAGASFHLNIECPPGTYFAVGRLSVTRSVGGWRQIIEIIDDDPSWQKVHMHYPIHMDSDDDIWSTKSIDVLEARLVLVIRPMYHGAMRAGINVLALTTMLLLVLTSVVAWPSVDWPSLGHIPIERADTNSVVSLVLLVPTVALASLIRHDEHLFAKRVMHRYRRRLGTVAVAAFVDAILFAAGVTGAWLGVPLVVSTGLAGLVTAVSWHSGRNSRRTDRY
jgi:hypothetical protein